MSQTSSALGIFTFDGSLYSSKRLFEAAEKQGQKPFFLNPFLSQIELSDSRARIFVERAELRLPQVVISRVGTIHAEYSLALLRQLETLGVRCVNSSTAILKARDKLWSLQILAQQSIAVPQTVAVVGEGEIATAVSALGGFPVVIKKRQGSKGRGVSLVSTMEEAITVVSSLQANGEHVLIQRFVGDQPGQDLRVFVVGGKAIAAMKRVAPPGEFRSNYHLGARLESVELNSKLESLALKAAVALELDIAGVDIIEHQGNLLILEVNASPGLEGIERATGKDIAATIIHYAVKLNRQ